MLCPVCGNYADDDAIVCPQCGKLLERTSAHAEEEELMKFRQGRHLRNTRTEEKPEEPPVRTGRSRAFEDPQPPVTPESTGEIYARVEVLSNTGKFYGLELDDPAEEMQPQRMGPAMVAPQYERRSRVKRHISHRRMINWAYVLIGIACTLVLIVVGAFLYLTRTTNGQIIMARMGKEATSTALWYVGEERFDEGDLDGAVEFFLRARAQDEEAEEPNPVGLRLLGEVYEAIGDLQAAEEVYAYVYTEVVPTDPAAYEAQVRVLREMGRDAEAAVLLQEAYQKTGVAAFRTTRSQILPAVPTVSVAGGYYTEKKTVEILQSQEHGIVYTFDLYAELPAEGIEYTGPLELGEGEHQIRAVAVNGDLVSDELEITYAIYMPTPLSPDTNLAPNTYSSARKNVKLWPRKLSDEDLEKNPGYAATLKDPVAQDITIYYTIDGSIPDADSPIFTGDPIVMDTNGYMNLRAVSVNGYGKQGNMKEVEIKLNLGTKTPKMYNTEDTINGMSLGTTNREAFETMFGRSEQSEPVWLYGVDGECVRYTYPWGYVTYMKQKAGDMLAELYFESGDFDLPRNTALGMTEEQIVACYKDFRQVVSPSGNRGLYEDEGNKGKIYVRKEGDTPVGKVIRYRALTADVHTWQLDYILNSAGRVEAVHWLYER